MDGQGRPSGWAAGPTPASPSGAAGGSASGPPGGPAPWVTPDAVALDLSTATVGSRGIAYVIDVGILFAGLLAIGLAEVILGISGFVPGWFGLALLLLFAFTWQFGYPIGFEVLLRGRTPGKAAMGLRVVTVEGLPVGIRHATIRAVVGLLELVGTFGMVAVIASLSSSRGQRLGDLAAGTIVLRERRSGGQPTAMVFRPPAGWEPYVARLDVSGLGSAERAAIRDTLRRMPDLPTSVRAEVVGELADALVARTTPPPPEGMTAEVWLRAVAAAMQRSTATARGGTGPMSWSTGATPAAAGPHRDPPPPPPVPAARLADAPPDRPATGSGEPRPADPRAPETRDLGSDGFAPPG